MNISAEGIRYLRFIYRLSQTAFAHKVGVTQQLIALIENGERRVTERTARKVAVAFNLSGTDLIEIERKAREINQEAVRS